MTRPAVDEEALAQAAIAARELAYAPYSRFKVGAAVLGVDGRIYTGCNVENVTFGLTTCAEQVAIMKAVSEGCRGFVAVAVCTETDPPATPCGLCRQMMVEFADDLDILLATPAGVRARTTLRAIMPHAFRPTDLPELPR